MGMYVLRKGIMIFPIAHTCPYFNNYGANTCTAVLDTAVVTVYFKAIEHTFSAFIPFKKHMHTQ